ncbi:MAG: hypothetical protein HAW62_04960 [Endozoicomonadaceae bacterium]|nr:hypothetical protein [Endozoicomonadaceae bacterium]
MNIIEFLQESDKMVQIILGALFLVWLISCYALAGLTEKKWGDRETGAVLGFFVPILCLMIYFRY